MSKELFKEYKYKVELHAHTSPMSICGHFSPEDMVDKYHELGADGVALTNHFTPDMNERFGSYEDALGVFIDDYRRAVARAEKYGMVIYFGAELRFKEYINDYLVFGIDEEYLRDVIKSFGEEGTFRYFRENYSKKGTFLIHAHPFRSGCERVEPALLDAVEGFNMHPGHNSRNAFAQKFAKENNKPITAGSDFHQDVHAGSAFTLFRKLPANTGELASALASNDYIFQLNGNIVVPYNYQG